MNDLQNPVSRRQLLRASATGVAPLLAGCVDWCRVPVPPGVGADETPTRDPTPHVHPPTQGDDAGGSASNTTEGGSTPDREWSLVFEDTFDSRGLDAEHWDVGWGWGRRTSTSPTRIVPENVEIRDGTLRLVGTHAGSEILSGAVNTKNKVIFGPGSYVEASLKFADRTGFHNAFWSKPNSEAWPPELDVVELWQSGDDPDATRTSHHHIHYPTSTVPGDADTHENVGVAYRPGGDLTAEFHVYGVEWQKDRIVHRVDGRTVFEFTDARMLRAVNRGAPFYLMLSLNINNIGTADTSDSWGESLDADWVRLWKQGGQSTDSTRES